MKICAYCGRENDDTAAQCRECGTEKFNAPSPVSADKAESAAPDAPTTPEPFQPRTLSPEERQQAFVTLKSCATVVEAYTLVMQLKEASVDAFIPDEALLTVGWNANTVRVSVPADQFDEAVDFLVAGSQLATAWNEPESELTKTKRSLPLSWPMRLLMFLLPAGLCPTLIVAALVCGSYRNKGYARRAEESYLMLLVGIAFWLLFWLLVLNWRKRLV